MGTNYYTRTNICNHCGRFDGVHIGKSSAGWVFLFNYNGGKYYSNKRELVEFLKTKLIVDEYGNEIGNEDFWKMVDSKKDCQRNIRAIDIGEFQFLDTEFS